MHPDVASYLRTTPAAQRETLTELRTLILKSPPSDADAFESGFPMYAIDGKRAVGFATRKKGPMLYIMWPGVLNRYTDRLGTLHSGNGRDEYRAAVDCAILS